MNCPFCQTELIKEDTHYCHLTCTNCNKLHGLETIFNWHNEELEFIHFYINSPGYQIKAIQVGPRHFPGSVHYYQSGQRYHVRLELLNNKTWVGLSNDSCTHLMWLPGTNFTPANVKDKLKMCLVFS